ncbi:MAG: hypothetical protein ACRDO1_08330 [Nocardioidaceae bacterium]
MRSDYYFTIGTMAQIVESSDAVVIGTAESAYRAETLGPAEDPTTPRILRVAVEQSFKGEQTQLTLRTLGWTMRDGAELRLVDPQPRRRCSSWRVARWSTRLGRDSSSGRLSRSPWLSWWRSSTTRVA